MRLVCCQEDSIYMLWQVDIMLDNFARQGIELCQCDIVVGYRDKLNPLWDKVISRGANLYTFRDTRVDKCYVPSIYFHLLAKYIAYTNINEPLMLHDCDIVFIKKAVLPKYDNKVLIANCSSYLDYNYIASKGEDIYRGMCDIVDINEDIPKISVAGGAQYLLDISDAAFWHKVESDSVKLYRYLSNHQQGQYPIQRWTSGMWALLWNMLRDGLKVEYTELFNFTMPTDLYCQLSKYPILHNSGVTHQNYLFNKCLYKNTIPYNLKHEVSKDYASYYYVEQMELARQSTLL